MTTISTRTQGILLAAGLATAALFVGVIHLGNALTPTGSSYPLNPLSLVLALGTGTPVPVAAIVFGVLAAAALVVVTATLISTASQTAEFDNTHKFLATTSQMAPLLAAARRTETSHLHPSAEDLPPGLALGRVVGRKEDAYQGWRELGVSIYGPGRGKTSSQVIPRAIGAPGACIMTSNKPDGVKEILAGRQNTGAAFVFDPQRVYRHNPVPDFTFNPLEHIHSITDARELVAIFEASTTKPGDKGGDSQFNEMGRTLLASFFYAAALAKMPLPQVHEWLVDVHALGSEAIAILQSHDKIGPARAIQGIAKQPERTSGSVYATAQRMATSLMNDDLLEWANTSRGRVLDPDAFVRSTDTLILLSKNGEGSGGALLTALVRAICKAAERIAENGGGRLPVPVVIELDECANVVRWPELPDVYSYYGSLGIVITAYFQSPDQGVAAFGKEGMGTLWSAASIRQYGGGVLDEQWLKGLSTLIGLRDEQVKGTSAGRGQTTTTMNVRRVPILDVAALAALPEWRAVVFPSKASPVIIELQPWFRNDTLKAQIYPAKDAA